MRDYGRGQELPRGGPRGGPGGPVPQPGFPAPTAPQLKAIIEEGEGETLVESARLVGKSLADLRLTTSQIRGIFGTVRQIEMRWPNGAAEAEARDSLRRLLLLKPRIAYQAKRAQEKRGGEGVAKLQDVLVPGIDMVKTREQFGHFVDYFEAIVAYHKAFGGKEQ